MLIKVITCAMMRKLIILYASLGFISCGVTNSANVSTSESWSGSTVPVKLPIHGHFCGGGHPEYLSSDRIEHASRIKNIVPTDDLDQICKDHDLCYALQNLHKLECDHNLMLASYKKFVGFNNNNNNSNNKYYESYYCDNIRKGINLFATFSLDAYSGGAVLTSAYGLGAAVNALGATYDAATGGSEKIGREEAICIIEPQEYKMHKKKKARESSLNQCKPTYKGFYCCGSRCGYRK